MKANSVTKHRLSFSNSTTNVLPGERTITLSQGLQHGVTLVACLLRKFIRVRNVVPFPFAYRFRANQQSDSVNILTQQLQWLEWSSVTPKNLISIHLWIQEIAIVWPQNFTQFDSTHRRWPAAIEAVGCFLWCRVHSLPAAIVFIGQAQIWPIHPDLIPHMIIPNRIWVEFFHDAARFVDKIVDSKWCLGVVCAGVASDNARWYANGSGNCNLDSFLVPNERNAQ